MCVCGGGVSHHAAPPRAPCAAERGKHRVEPHKSRLGIQCGLVFLPQIALCGSNSGCRAEIGCPGAVVCGASAIRCVCVCPYVFMFACGLMHVHVCICVHACACLHAYLHVNSCACLCTRIHMEFSTCPCVCVHASACVCTCLHVFMRMDVSLHVCTWPRAIPHLCSWGGTGPSGGRLTFLCSCQVLWGQSHAWGF